MSVPRGWTVKSLDQLAETALGKMLDRGKSRGLIEVPYLRNVNVQWGHIDTNDLLTMELAYDEHERFQVIKGDLLVCEGGEVGRAAIWNGREEYLAYQKALHRVRSRGDLDLRFFRYLLEHYHHNGALTRYSTGSTIAHLPQQKLRALPVPHPPLIEQKHIVEILEDHLSRLDAATGGVGENRKKLDALRLATLSHALFGKNDWHTERLLDLLEKSIGGLWGSEPGGSDVDVCVLRVTEMRKGGHLALNTAARRSVSKRQLEIRQLRSGDILLEKSGGGPTTPVGRVGLVTELDGPSICSNFMHLMRPRADLVLPRFLHLYLHAFYMRGGTESMQKASTNIRNLKGSEYVQLQVPVPDLATQRMVVDDVGLLFEGIARIESDATKAISRAASLRRTLLEAAFTGSFTGRSTDHIKIEEMPCV